MPNLPSPICFSALLRVNASRYGLVAVQPGDDLLLLSNPSAFDGRRNLSIHYSLSGGRVWSPLAVVEDRGLRGSSCKARTLSRFDRACRLANQKSIAISDSGMVEVTLPSGQPAIGVVYSQDWHVASLSNLDPVLNTTFALLTGFEPPPALQAPHQPPSTAALKTDDSPDKITGGLHEKETAHTIQTTGPTSGAGVVSDSDAEDGGSKVQERLEAVIAEVVQLYTVARKLDAMGGEAGLRERLYSFGAGLQPEDERRVARAEEFLSLAQHRLGDLLQRELEDLEIVHCAD